MRQGSSLGNNRGFTLIEILIALTVASIALAVLVQGLGQYVNQFVYLKERSIAQTIATSELAHKSLNYDYVMREYIEQGGTEWQLHYAEEDYPFRDLEGLKEIKVTIYSKAGQAVFSTSSIIYAPEL